MHNVMVYESELNCLECGQKLDYTTHIDFTFLIQEDVYKRSVCA